MLLLCRWNFSFTARNACRRGDAIARSATKSAARREVLQEYARCDAVAVDVAAAVLIFDANLAILRTWRRGRIRIYKAALARIVAMWNPYRARRHEFRVALNHRSRTALAAVPKAALRPSRA